MPIYPFVCDQGHQQDITARAPEECQEHCATCGARLVRVWTAPAAHFKGSGFYATDYAKTGSRGGA